MICTFFNILGWMYEERGKGRKISWKTKVWLLGVKIFSGASKPMLYSYQGSLPRLPLPSLEDTMKRVSKHVKTVVVG